VAKIKKIHGLTMLYRTAGVWNVFQENIAPQEIPSVHRSCKLSTLAPWIWWGPSAIAAWMVENPTANEAEMPRRVILEAQKQMDREVALLTPALELVKSLREGLKLVVRPTKREVRAAQKAEASRRKR
jgi:hypothetical protein